MIDLRLGDCLTVLRSLESESVHCVVTSPPYWGLRSYQTEPQVWTNGHEPCIEHQWGDVDEIVTDGRTRNTLPADLSMPRGYGRVGVIEKTVSNRSTCSICGAWRGELGLEPTPELYVEHITQIFREVKRVLRDDGSLWLNLGDSYATGASNGNGGLGEAERYDELGTGTSGKWAKHRKIPAGLKPKDLVGIPWMVAFALRADGWYLRSDCIWAKPNPMPESVTDRPTKAHEYLFLMSKSQKYYYDADAVRENFADERMGNPGNYKNGYSDGAGRNDGATKSREWLKGTERGGRNRRTVWTVATHPFNGAKLLADYVGDDGKPYKASVDCPLHGHLARSRMSDTRVDDEPRAESVIRIAGNDDGHDQESFCESKPKTCHSRAEVSSGSVRGQTHPDTCDCRTSIDQTADALPAQTSDRSLRTSESRERSGHNSDSLDPARFLTANGRSKRKSKTGRARQTSERDSVSVQTLFDTPNTLQSGVPCDSAGRTHESNTLTDDSSARPLVHIDNRNADKFSSQGLYCTCSVVSIDHFATFPPKLIEPCILAGTSAKGVCSKCGAPWERVTERGELIPDNPKDTHGTIGDKYDGMYEGMAQRMKPRHHFENKEIGWRPTCDCDAGDPVPATVLDLFNGAGTTGVVAVSHNRNYIGIDLKPEYIEMARERIEKVQPALVTV